MRYVLFIALMAVAVGLMFFAIPAIRQGNLAVALAPQPAALIQAVTATSTDFNETGTLVFYPNNVGPIPYLFYLNQSGFTSAKSLIFPDGPPVNLSSWAGARIAVTGKLNQEHVVVNRIRYVSPP